MKKSITLAALMTLATLTIPALAVDAAAVMDLAQQSGCLACHALDQKLVGPAWKDVGKKYSGDSAAAEQLATKIKKGTKGAWGSVPMPPNPTVTDADIRTLVEFVLTLK